MDQTMNQTQELLECVVRGARMGRDSLEQLIRKTDDDAMRAELMAQKNLYEDTQQTAEEQLYNAGGRATPLDMTARAGAWMGMQVNTMMDKSNAHFADIVIQGATMGVIDATKARNRCPEADAQAQGVASRFITQQQDCIEKMKTFLV